MAGADAIPRKDVPRGSIKMGVVIRSACLSSDIALDGGSQSMAINPGLDSPEPESGADGHPTADHARGHSSASGCAPAEPWRDQAGSAVPP